MANKNSFKFSGLVNKKSVGIDSGTEQKGVTLLTKKQTSELLRCYITHSYAFIVDSRQYVVKKTALTKNRRKTFHSIRKTLGSNFYRKDLIEVLTKILSILTSAFL